jgi:hypothetical protein
MGSGKATGSALKNATSGTGQRGFLKNDADFDLPADFEGVAWVSAFGRCFAIQPHVIIE